MSNQLFSGFETNEAHIFVITVTIILKTILLLYHNFIHIF